MEYGYGVSESASGNKDTGFLVDPLSFLRSGYYYWSDGSSYYRSGHGRYWSSTSATSTNAYDLNFDSAHLSYRNSLNRGYGFPVRCGGGKGLEQGGRVEGDGEARG